MTRWTNFPGAKRRLTRNAEKYDCGEHPTNNGRVMAKGKTTLKNDK